MKIRMKFRKTGPLIYVGHLDLLRYFQKVFRRAGVDISYSSGYSPHQILSFAAPLGLGITSEGEYLDAEFRSTLSSKEMLAKINAATGVDDIEVTEFVQLPDDAVKAMAAVDGADYRIRFREGYFNSEQFFEAVEAFYAQETIPILKKTKKSEKIVDIKPMIHAMRVEDDAITMRLSTGSRNNLKPELVMESLCQFLHQNYQDFAFAIHRIDTLLLVEEEGQMQFRPLTYVGSSIA